MMLKEPILRDVTKVVVMMLLVMLGAAGTNAASRAGNDTSESAAFACNYSISPDVHLFPATGGEITVSIQAFGTPGDPCGWTTVDAVPWITLSRVAGNGSGTLKVTVSPNNTTSERTASVAIAGRTFTAFQAAACTYTVNANPKQFGAAGGNGTLTITPSGGACTWSVNESATWIALSGATSGMGTKQVPFTVSANNGPGRTAAINVTTAVGVLAVTINQDSGCVYSLNPANQAVNAGGGNFSLLLSTSAGACPWEPTTNVPWITLANNAQKTGSGAWNYAVAANNGPQRTGTIYVAGKTLTVTQNSGCSFSLSPVGRHFNANGGGGVVTVGASHNACQWTAISNDPFITILNGASGQGTDTVTYNVAANYGAARSGSATIAGKTFGVSQEAFSAAAPTLTSLSPAATFAGGASFTLTVNGTDFDGSSRVQWNGADRPTTFVSKTQLQAQIFSPDIAAPGSVDVRVVNTAAGVASNTLKFMIFTSLANLSAASFRGEFLAPDSLVSAFGAGLATQTAVANGANLPTSLAGTSVRVRDSQGVEKLAQLFFVSPGQINYVMPSGLAAGKATVTVLSGAGQTLTGATDIANVAPGIFSADASGKGLASAIALRVRGSGQQVFEPVARYDAAQKSFQALPIELNIPGEQVYLLLFGTGLRHRENLTDVTVEIGGYSIEPMFAGAAPGLPGIDQLNVAVPAELAGAGDVDVVVKVAGKIANIVKLNFR